MRKSLSLSSTTLCFLFLLFTAGDMRPCGQGSGSGSTIVNLPTLGGSVFQVNALNSGGELTGFSYTTSNLTSHAFLFAAGTLQDIGTLGGNNSQGFALNGSGQIVGDSGVSGDAETHAFLYSGSAMIDLGTLGGSYSSAIGINDGGQITGNSWLAGDGEQQGFLYANGSMTNIGDLGSGSSFAAAINAAGCIVGDSSTSDFNDHAFVYTNGMMVDLGTLGGDYSAAFAINDAGTIIGESSLIDGSIHAFRYLGGVLGDAGTLGGTYSSPVAINNAGQTIGYSTTANDEQTHGFIYDGVMTDLGTLGGTYTEPAAINNLGQIVGDSGLSNNTAHAFLWQNGHMVDLNGLLPENSGWELISARLINDAGRIAGVGRLNGIVQWFMLDLPATNNPPVAIAIADPVVDCQSPVILDGSHSTDPDGDALSYEWSEATTILGSSSILTISLPLGTHTISLKVTDPCGAFSQTNVIVLVKDSTAPSISCPGLITISSGPTCQALVPDLLLQLVATDNCAASGSLTIIQDPAAGTTVGSGDHTIAFTATDPSGNNAYCSTVLRVVDTTPPVIVSGPVLGVISAGVNCQAAVPSVISQIVATDNCTPANALVITQNPLAGTLVGLGQQTITVTVADASGNTASGFLNFSVADTTPPSILVASGPLTLGVSADCQVPAPNVLASIVAADNCTPANLLVLTQVPAAGSLLGLGEHQITVSVTDASGNSASTNVSVTVVDSTVPSILSAPASVTIACQALVPNVIPDIVAADNCTPANQLVITQSPAAGTVVTAGQNVITVTVTDLSGNSVSRNVALIVADTAAPTINSVTATPNVLSPPNHQIVPVTISVSASDSCDPTPVSKIIAVSCNETLAPSDVQITGDLTLNLAATRNPAGGGRVYTITIRCSDASGNSSNGTVTVSVPKGNDMARIEATGSALIRINSEALLVRD